MKKIMIIDDSALMRRALSDIIKNTDEYEVGYTANNGAAALEIIEAHIDDLAVCLCDIDMPQMDGLEFLRMLKTRHYALPVIIISASENPRAAIEAVRCGAVEFIGKPVHLFRDDQPEFRKKLQSALDKATKHRPVRHVSVGRTSEGVRFVNRSLLESSGARSQPVQEMTQPAGGYFARPSAESVQKAEPAKKADPAQGRVEHYPKAERSRNVLVALVCSTGGPKALQSVIPYLPENLAAPVVLVQHMPAGFTKSMAHRLDELSRVHVKEAEEGDRIRPGWVYIAKGGMHLRLRPAGRTSELFLDDAPPVVGLKPCGNLMYDSLLESEYDEIVCVVLTGMGADGTAGIKGLSKKKRIFVIAQDEASSTVYGMPKAIYESGLTNVVCDLHEVANEITKKVGVL